ncbi:MAG: DUF4335 domain-containing protein [Pleurocapsa sp.]
MSIKRQYSQPNCVLVLEGLEDTSEAEVDILDGQSPMSILVNAECNFISCDRTLSGGSIFLENLSQAVNAYAQSLLSGLPHPQPASQEYPQIRLEKTPNNHLHRLTVETEPNSGESQQIIDLTTVEFFDLVDALDQLYSDRSTLPHLSLELQALNKRYRTPEQPLVERATPAVVGFVSLALVSAVLFLIPPPPVPEPETQVTPTQTLPTDDR